MLNKPAWDRKIRHLRSNSKTSLLPDKPAVGVRNVGNPECTANVSNPAGIKAKATEIQSTRKCYGIVPHQPTTKCSGPLSRREWLRLGGLSLGALAGGTVPTQSGLLQSAAAEKKGSNQSDDFSVILFWANGGPSHIDLFDLKPDAPVEYRGPFSPIHTSVPGIEISDKLPRLASLAEKFTLIRSLHHKRNQHSGGTHRFLSGYSSRAANLADAEYPEIGSVVSESLQRTGRASIDVPPLLANTKFYGGGPAYLGPSFSPFMPNPNPQSSSGNNQYDPVPIYSTGDRTDNLSITSNGILKLNRRRAILKSLDSLPRTIDASGMMNAVDRFQDQAIAMLGSSRVRQAFDLNVESSETRERYGDTHWGKSLLTCRRLVEAGVRMVQCQATYRLKPETGRTSNWDDHSVNSHIFNAYREKLPSFDQSVSALIEDIYSRGLDKKVLFVFCGEFGRTPRIRNQDASGRPGRDHWAQAMSVLVAGGGLQMGQVIGATNSRAEEPVRRIMDSNCLLATLYHKFGIDTKHSYLDNSGRPLPILTDGEVIPELL
jgi:hypothetical protein